MNKIKAIAVILMAVFFATLAIVPVAPKPVEATLWPTTPPNLPLRGPHFQNIWFVVYSGVDAEIPALKAGDIDIMDFSISPSQYEDLKSDPTLDFTTMPEQGFWYIAIQCKRHPLDVLAFRQALAYLTDKDKIISESSLAGAAEKLDSVLATSYGAWYDPNITGRSEYNPAKAAQLLDQAGFTKGADGWRIDPQTGTKLRTLTFYARVEHPHRVFSAQTLAAAMQAAGIPVDVQIVTRSVTSVKVMQEQDYDLYTAGFGAGPDVDWLYDLFEGSRPPEQNYELYDSPNYNHWAQLAKFGTDYETVKNAVWKCQEVLFDEVPGIFLYAMYSVCAYKNNLKNVVTYAPLGGYTANMYTYMLGYREGTTYGGDLKVGCSSDFTQPSPLYEVNWWWDGYVVSSCYDSLILLDPYTFAEDPWLAKSWTVTPWTAPGNISGMKLTFQLCDNVTWHDGVKLTAEDAAFTIKYMQEKQCPVYISYVQNVVDAVASGTYTLDVYLNVSSYWALHWIGSNLPIVPKHIWQNVEDPNTYQPILEGTLIGSGAYMFKDYRPGEYLVLTANPNYFRRPVDSTLSFQEIQLTQGDKKDFTQPPQIILGQTITNGTYTLEVLKADGSKAKTAAGTVGSDGTYTVTLDTTGMDAGTYTLILTLDLPVTAVGSGSVERYKLVINPWLSTTMILGIGAVVVVAVAAGYIVLRRRPKKKAA